MQILFTLHSKYLLYNYVSFHFTLDGRLWLHVILFADRKINILCFFFVFLILLDGQHAFSILTSLHKLQIVNFLESLSRFALLLIILLRH